MGQFFSKKKKSMNPFENFEANFEKERKIQQELERIELAYAKTAEKYKSYSECLDFAHYIKTIEKVFAEAKVRQWSEDRVKDSLIKSKIAILSHDNIMDEEVLNAIYNDFRQADLSIGKINEIAGKLRKKYEGQEDCIDFISYIADTFINFSDFKENKLSLDEMKSRLIQARMKVLASDGKPELRILEGIYKEFKSELGGV